MKWPDYVSDEEMGMLRKEWMLMGYTIRQWSKTGGWWAALEAQDPHNYRASLYVCEDRAPSPRAIYTYFELTAEIGVWERDFPRNNP